MREYKNTVRAWARLFLLWLLLVLAGIVISLWVEGNVGASWRYNPFTREQDYYEDLEDGELSVPRPYTVPSTMTELVKILVAAGIMEYPSIVGILHEDRSGIEHTDRGDLVHEDRLRYNW